MSAICRDWRYVLVFPPCDPVNNGPLSISRSHGPMRRVLFRRVFSPTPYHVSLLMLQTLKEAYSVACMTGVDQTQGGRSGKHQQAEESGQKNDTVFPEYGNHPTVN